MLLYFLLVYSPFRHYEIFPSRDSAMFYNQFDRVCKTGANDVGTACNSLMKTEAESGFRDIRRFHYLVSPAFLICIFACLSVSGGSFSLCLVLAGILRYVFKTLNPIQNRGQASLRNMQDKMQRKGLCVICVVFCRGRGKETKFLRVKRKTIMMTHRG